MSGPPRVLRSLDDIRCSQETPERPDPAYPGASAPQSPLVSLASTSSARSRSKTISRERRPGSA